MRKNEAGLTILEIGDVVRVGNGRVHYTVTVPESDANPYVTVRSHNTDKPTTIERERLHLVQSVQDAAYEAGCSEGELVGSLGGVPAADKADAPVVENTSYQKAVLLALNLKGKHVYAGTVRPNVKAKRRSLGRRQKASRVANR